MNMRLIQFCAAAILCFAGSTAATTTNAAEPTYEKIPSNGVTFKKKSGYWTECRYDGLGTVCETIYAKPKNGKLRPVPAGAAKLTKKAGQVMVCYWGSNNAEICYWAYSPRKAK